MVSQIRRADLDGDRGILIKALSQWLSPKCDERRFDWLYRNCPHGQALTWVAFSGQDGTVVGAASAFPRKMYVKGRLGFGCVLGDFFIAPEYRSLGPAVRLQRTCMAGVSAESFDFFYDFPAQTMVPVYKRLGLEPSEKLLRLAKPLRADRKVREWVKPSAVAYAVTGIANLALRMRADVFGNSHTCELEVYQGPCREEFTELANAIQEQYGICAVRSAEYLNWRYRNHFERSYEFLTARREGKLLAYAVYWHDGEDAEIADIFGINEGEVVEELIAEACHRLRRQGIVTVSAPLLASNPWLPVLEELGFRQREWCPVIIRSAIENSEESTERQRCLLMQGDRES